ncbi:MAG: aerial mycelium formation protein [Candidatus Nanopelagicales bacterium]
MTRPVPGGRRRIDRVLAPAFVADLSALPLDELRARRAEVDQEEADLSYLRRLLQGRIDLLDAELRGRAGGTPPSEGRHHVATSARGAQPGDEALVARLVAALAEPIAPPHGSGRHLTAEPSRVGESRRRVERAWSDPALSDPARRSSEELGADLVRLRALESEVSEVRHEVHRVGDLLAVEVGRRYRDGDASVEALLDRGSEG